MDKYKELIKSRRFQLATLVWVSALLELLITQTLTAELFFNVSQIYVGVIIGIGTIDGVAKKIGGK